MHNTGSLQNVRIKMANASGGEDAQLSFPLPPTFYFKKYTNENVKTGNVPSPPSVVSGEYCMFGHTQKVEILAYCIFVIS